MFIRALSLAGCASLFGMALVGCAPPAAPEPAPQGRSLHDDTFLPAPRPDGVGRSVHALTTGDGPLNEQVLFINFEGATLTRAGNNGGDDASNAPLNRSWVPNKIPVGSSVAYPAFDASPYAPNFDAATVKTNIVNQVKTWYAPYNVFVTATRPTSGRYTMMLVGGQASTFISPSGSAVGVAPLDCGNDNQNDIGFAFSDSLEPGGSSNNAKLQAIKMVAQTIAHESGHSFGLEHVNSTGSQLDIMEPAVDPGVTGFLNMNLALSDGGSSCGSGSTANSNNRLMSNLGPTPGGTAVIPKPTIAWLAPKNGDKVPRQFTVAVSASQPAGASGTITHVDIEQEGQNLASISAPPYQETFTVPSNFPNGQTVQLTAIAYNSAGGQMSVTTQFTIDSSATQAPIGCLITADCQDGKACSAGACVDPSTVVDMGGGTDADGGTSMGPGAGNGEIGSACTDASQCGAGGVCATVDGVSFCSRRCDESDGNSCPANYQCTASGASHYCTPTPSGCTVGPVASPRAGTPAFFALVVLALVLAMRRSREAKRAM